MIKRIIIFLHALFASTSGYVILDGVRPSFPKVLAPCEDIDPILLKSVYEVAKNVPWLRISSINNTGHICNQNIGHYGYTLPYGDGVYTNVWIKNELFDFPNTLYNVLLHEILHSMGLNHNNGEQGLMDYSVSMTGNWWNNNIKNDDRKLWLSLDDLRGLIYLKDRHQSKNEYFV